MKKVAIAVVVLVGVVIVWVLVVGIISPLNPVPGDYRGLSISMGIGGGWCVCSEQWDIDGNGNVSYELSGPLVAHWSSSAKMSPQQVGELVAAIKKANLWALQDSYGIGQVMYTDSPRVDLSVTFNGWSKHISYDDPSCSNGWAPQAVCDLQHKIEAIDRDRLAMPTPGPWPTSTPAPTLAPAPTSTLALPPTPTSPPPPFMATGDFGILSQEPCGPPCFLGIRPGVTTFDEAALILKNAGAPCIVITRGKSLLCQSGDTSIGLSTTEPCTPDNGGLMVAEIGLRPPARITLGDFIGRYGPPDLLIAAGGASPAMFSHDNLQALVFLPSQLGPQPPYTFTPDTIISYFAYETVTGYAKCVQMEGNKLQPWKGYGTYTPKMNP